MARISRGEPVEHFETVRRRKSGELIDVSLIISPIRAADGSIVGASHIVRYVTVRRRTDEESARLAAIVQSSDDAIVSKTLDGMIPWNHGAERVYGFPAAEAIGRPMLLVIPEDRAEEEAKILERIGRGEEVEHFETVRRRKDGELVTVSLTISPIYGKSGHVMGISHIARDVSRNRKLEERLEQLAAIVKSAEDAIISKTLEGKILTWNAAAERIYGYPAGEANRQLNDHTPSRMSVAPGKGAILAPPPFRPSFPLAPSSQNGPRYQGFASPRPTTARP